MPDDQNGGNPPGGPGSGPLSGPNGPFPPNPKPGVPADELLLAERDPDSDDE